LSDLVLDSGIFLASVLPDEPLTRQAQAMLLAWTKSETRLIAPRLFRSELVAVVRKAVFQSRITHEQGAEFLNILLETPVTFFEDDDLLREAYKIAYRFNLPRAYDAQYLALAERFQVDFWTADETLYNSISSRFSYIRWLGQFTPPPEQT
jgi:predicted nucleic acid-binding protein